MDHNRKIHHVSEPFYGGTNDKTVTANDTFPCKVTAGMYRDVEYVLYNAHGVPKLCKGRYLIVDGGYKKLGYLICPRSYPSTIQNDEDFQQEEVHGAHHALPRMRGGGASGVARDPRKCPG